MVKQYIVSVDNEIKEYFGKTIQLIEESVKKDVLGTPLISSNIVIGSIVEKHMDDFVHTAISVVDYYVEGIFNGGKQVSRKKLKLGKQIPSNGKKYSFSHQDEMFIEKYKSNKLTAMNHELNNAVVDYLFQLITKKINGRWNLDDDNDYQILEYSKQEMVDDEMGDILKIVNTCLTSVYDEFIETIIREIVVLFKRAQIEEYKNLGINVITFTSSDDSSSCPICNARSGKVVPINSITTDLGIKDGTRHALCKFTIDPVISYKSQITDFYAREFGLHSEYSSSNDQDLFLNREIKPKVDFDIKNMKFINVPIEIESRIINVIKKMQIYAPKYLKELEFKFIDNITDTDEWVEVIKNHHMSKGKNDFEAENEAFRDQDNLKYSIATFTTGNTVFVSPMSLDSQPIENLILREIFKPQLEISQEVEDLFNERKESKHVGHGVAFYQLQFISYLAEESAKDYLVESVIAYITNKNKLQAIDEKIYNYIKENVFDSIEF